MACVIDGLLVVVVQVMVSVASPSPMVRSEEDLGPPWLRPLLGTSFFVPCRLHPELSKNECNLFCLGCTGDALCAYCLPAHRDHHVVQVGLSYSTSSDVCWWCTSSPSPPPPPPTYTNTS